MKMAEMQFTTDELQTLVWALNSKLIESKMAAIKAERPYSEATERLNKMCSRAYHLLVKTLDEECESAAP